MIDEATRRTAAQCRHYAMCKIDYLGTGLCPSGPEKGYVAYWPQGRMDLCRALADGLVPLTETLLDVADTCTLCGACDKQCHFVTGMRPLAVMRALKDEVRAQLAAGRPLVGPAADPLLDRLRAIVGDAWASHDPAILFTYADDPFPLAGPRTPRAVVLPGSTDEVARVVALANEEGLDIAIRGNGGSVFGFVFTDGIVLDMNRMRALEIDPANWCARVGPGVTSFELQREAVRHGLRANAAEPAATVCGNIVCTGTFSTWSNAYGTAADNYVDLEFVDRSGRVFHTNDRDAPNVFAFARAVTPSPGICTHAVVRLHPMTDDEEGILAPCPDLDSALDLARDLARRRIGIALGILGGHYIATFMSPSRALSDRIKRLLPDRLGIRYLVFAVGDAYAREAIRKIAGTVIDADLFRTLMLGLPRLVEHGLGELAAGWEGKRPPYEILCRPEMRPLIDAALRPAPETIASVVDEDLRDFYAELYRRPEMTDMVWLNMFRVVSARLARHRHVFVLLAYVPLDRHDVIHEILDRFAKIAEARGIDHDYGFITPMDFGQRAILEYDYYIDHTDETERRKIAQAMAEIGPWLDALAESTPGVTLIPHVFSQGCSRKENFFYR